MNQELRSMCAVFPFEEWSQDQVRRFFCTYQGGRYAAEYDVFKGLDGNELAYLTEDQVRKRSPEKGDILFNLFRQMLEFSRGVKTHVPVWSENSFVASAQSTGASLLSPEADPPYIEPDNAGGTSRSIGSHLAPTSPLGNGQGVLPSASLWKFPSNNLHSRHPSNAISPPSNASAHSPLVKLGESPLSVSSSVDQGVVVGSDSHIFPNGGSVFFPSAFALSGHPSTPAFASLNGSAVDSGVAQAPQAMVPLSLNASVRSPVPACFGVDSFITPFVSPPVITPPLHGRSGSISDGATLLPAGFLSKQTSDAFPSLLPQSAGWRPPDAFSPGANGASGDMSAQSGQDTPVSNLSNSFSSLRTSRVQRFVSAPAQSNQQASTLLNPHSANSGGPTFHYFQGASSTAIVLDNRAPEQPLRLPPGLHPPQHLTGLQHNASGQRNDDQQNAGSRPLAVSHHGRTTESASAVLPLPGLAQGGPGVSLLGPHPTQAAASRYSFVSSPLFTPTNAAGPLLSGTKASTPQLQPAPVVTGTAFPPLAGGSAFTPYVRSGQDASDNPFTSSEFASVEDSESSASTSSYAATVKRAVVPSSSPNGSSQSPSQASPLFAPTVPTVSSPQTSLVPSNSSASSVGSLPHQSPTQSAPVTSVAGIPVVQNQKRPGIGVPASPLLPTPTTAIAHSSAHSVGPGGLSGQRKSLTSSSSGSSHSYSHSHGHNQTPIIINKLKKRIDTTNPPLFVVVPPSWRSESKTKCWLKVKKVLERFGKIASKKWSGAEKEFCEVQFIEWTDKKMRDLVVRDEGRGEDMNLRVYMEDKTYIPFKMCTAPFPDN